MQIPQELQHYEHPTLIVVGDFEHAVIHLAHDKDLTEVATIEAPELHQPDTEGSVTIGGGRTANPSTDVDEGARRVRYTKQIVDKIVELQKSNDIQFINLIMPAEMCRRLQDGLPSNMKTNVTKVLEVNIAKAPMLDVLRRLEA
ncbi:MAG: hypothetical protein PHS79_05580 [Patescibacteria group bacterium]|nr:hypothetical protein [Patescibacteria group bacterium]